MYKMEILSFYIFKDIQKVLTLFFSVKFSGDNY